MFTYTRYDTYTFVHSCMIYIHIDPMLMTWNDMTLCWTFAMGWSGNYKDYIWVISPIIDKRLYLTLFDLVTTSWVFTIT